MESNTERVYFDKQTLLNKTLIVEFGDRDKLQEKEGVLKRIYVDYWMLKNNSDRIYIPIKDIKFWTRIE